MCPGFVSIVLSRGLINFGEVPGSDLGTNTNSVFFVGVSGTTSSSGSSGIAEVNSSLLDSSERLTRVASAEAVLSMLSVAISESGTYSYAKRNEKWKNDHNVIWIENEDISNNVWQNYFFNAAPFQNTLSGMWITHALDNLTD